MERFLTVLSFTLLLAGSAYAQQSDTYTNPVINSDFDFADSEVLMVGDTYWVYATGTRRSPQLRLNIQVARSRDLANWEILSTDALPHLPSWAQRDKPWHTWSGGVVNGSRGKYVMFFTTRHAILDRQCIGRATSDKPEGPFVSPDPAHFICHFNEGGSIDASIFVNDDGSHYLLWKNNGNSTNYGKTVPQPTWIYIQRISADLLTLDGNPVRLIVNDKPWEGSMVEGANLWKRGGKYYLFYSGGSDYAKGRYAIGYAVADTIMGPYRKPTDRPLMTGTPASIGPGGPAVVLSRRGETWILYHAQNRIYESWTAGVIRRLQIDKLDWEGDRPILRGPTNSPQPAP